MTQEQQSVRDWMLAVGQSCPSKPTIPSLEVRKLRAKLKLEEALETIVDGLGVDLITKDNVTILLNLLESVNEWEFSPLGEPNLVKIADGCEDLKVVTEGTLVACGLIKHCEHEWEQDEADFYCKKCHIDDMTAYHTDNRDPLFSEVMRSNFSKFLTPDEFSQQVESNSSNPNWLPHTVYTDDTKQTIKYIVVKDASGKVMKGPSYSPPNLQPIIDEMSK